MKKRELWSVGAFAGAVIVLAIRVLSEFGGFTHPESNVFLRVYNDCSRPVYKIVFDPRLTGWGAYQARELSYLVDCFDARFIYACAARGLTIHWDAQNDASVHMAEQHGFLPEQDYAVYVLKAGF